MDVKRRDNKGRILRDRESQRKDGKYRFSYIKNGKRADIYSWRLEPTDKLPKGKRNGPALRTMEAEILKQELLGETAKPSMDVLTLVKRYLKTKRGVRETTKTGYQTVLNFLEKEEFARYQIYDVHVSDARLWLISLQDRGKSYSAIHTIRGVLRPAFQTAVEDELLNKNPFEFQLASALINDSVRREALTAKQEENFLEFVKADAHFSKYYDAIYILFKTGMRISEFCGLTLSDIDLFNRKITVDHQLQRTSKMKYIIEETKSVSGKRILPMTDEVYEAFKRIISKRKAPKVEMMIDGKSGFLFYDKNGKPMVALHWQKYFQHITEKYNRIYKDEMPKVTPHVCRHTYCTNMAKSGISAKSLQYLMGHADIAVTYNVYTHIGFEDVQKEVKKLSIAK